MPKNDSWGIEVGANAIKAMRLQREGNEVEVLDYDVLPFKRILTTPDLDVDQEVRVGLEQFMARHDLSKSNVVLAVPGHLAFARFAKLPPVEPKRIGEIVKYEAMQQIPFPINEVEWDYQVFQQEDSPDAEVGIFAITKERVMTFLRSYQQMGMKIDALTLSPVAVYNAFAYDLDVENTGEGTIILDIGTTSSDLIVVEGGRIWLRTMAIGGNNFTEALVKAFKLSFPKAEKLKREAATHKHARHIFTNMRPVFAELVQEIQRSLGFYQQTNRDSDLKRMVCVGSTFRLPGLQKFLKQQLELDVVRPDNFNKARVEGKQASDFAANALNLATAYGCALQGVELESVTANILPEHIIKARVWKAKQPWFAAAAALILLATILPWFKLNNTRNAYEAALADTKAVADPIKAQAQQKQQEMKDRIEKEDPRMQIENLNRVLDYRDVWPKILEDISLATKALGPQPELLTVQSEQSTIPREQRRRVYIESVTATYDKGQAATAAGADPNAPSPAPQQRGQAQPAQPAPGLAAEDVFAEGATPPSFTITIKGITPYRDNTPSFLSRHLIKWLNDNAERTDRPYKLVVARNPFVRLTDVKKEDLEDPKDPNNRTGEQQYQQDPRGGGGREIVPPAGGRSIVPPAGGRNVIPRPEDRFPGDERFPGQDGAEDETVDEDLFPPRPTPKIVAGDYVFVVEWKVVLLKPDVVRSREDAAKDDKTQATEDAPADKSAAADDANAVANKEPRS